MNWTFKIQVNILGDKVNTANDHGSQFQSANKHGHFHQTCFNDENIISSYKLNTSN